MTPIIKLCFCVPACLRMVKFVKWWFMIIIGETMVSGRKKSSKTTFTVKIFEHDYCRLNHWVILAKINCWYSRFLYLITCCHRIFVDLSAPWIPSTPISKFWVTTFLFTVPAEIIGNIFATVPRIKIIVVIVLQVKNLSLLTGISTDCYWFLFAIPIKLTV